MQPNIWTPCDEILWNLIFSSTCVLSHLGAIKVQKYWRKRILKVKWKSYKPLNSKGYCKKYMGFPLKMAAKWHNFCKVSIGLFATKRTLAKQKWFHDILTFVCFAWVVYLCAGLWMTAARLVVIWINEVLCHIIVWTIPTFGFNIDKEVLNSAYWIH